MKLNKAEIIIIALTGAFVAFSLGYFVGISNTGDAFVIETEKETQSLQESAVPSLRASEPSASADPAIAEPAAAEISPEIESAVDSHGRININKAGVEDLKTLDGVGDVIALRIIDYREKNGEFESVEDIMLVEGIGKGIFNKISQIITVGDK